MEIKINGTEIAAYPDKFSPGIMDIDDADSSIRTADALLHRDRVAVKRQLDMSWGVLRWPEISALLKSMADASFTVTYPDPQEGIYVTKLFYVGNRTAAVALSKGAEILWSGLKLTLTEY
ncbi:DUF6711 family protein [Paenibacillus sp. FSL R7-0204]|uniref:DUF6711 family protein n=1 Tax=Paenibacillus sp. FSL R7-0204 TaxID=2921675 RepID=UPI0030F88155